MISNMNDGKPVYTRRRFTASAALLAAAGAFSNATPGFAAPSEASTRPSPVRLGIASYTFRDFTRARLIADMKQLDVFALNAKDTKDHLPMDPVEERQALEAYRTAGIRLHAVGTVYFLKDDEADIRGKFEYAKRAGVPVIVAGGPSPSILPRIEKFVKAYNIKFAIHNHGPEDKLWPSPLTVLNAVKNMDPRMGCCLDVGHTAHAGTDVVQAIHKAGSRLFNVHMKDLANFHDERSQVAVGMGKMPVRSIFEALIETRYPGFVDLEYEVQGDDPMPGVTASFAYMRGVLAGMGYRSEASSTA